MPAPKTIIDSVKAFQADYNRYMSSDYKEARVRIEFIDPFLEALGWHPGKSEYTEDWRDCVVEQTIEVNEDKRKQRADYTCRLGRNPVMMVEAKKPSEHAFGRPKFARQVRLYAYSSPEVSLAVLTTFEELAIYNGRVIVRKEDDAEDALIAKYRFTEYIDKWDEIELLLSKRTIMTLQHREALRARPVRGLIPLDQTILTEIDGWREDLALTIARQNRPRLINKELTAEDINLAVGRTIDRLLFLRVAEAKGIEPHNQLRKIAGGANIYDKLKRLFLEADIRYNSGLFYFEKEKERHEQPDTLTLSLDLETAPLKQIIVGMYEPENRFEYSCIPIEILGQVYEQFLGNVVTLNSELKASIVPKPEVKKAGGVFYTPSYIVNYIVKSVLDPLLQDKTPKQIANLRILDPACGSGSFLLGAYQYLLEWYRRYYKTDGPSKHQKEIAPDTVEDFILTLHERKRILLTHIYGVDIDPQAVEVAKFSLLLKVLEGETRDTVETEFKRHKHALPDLGDNIKCGNSLIGTDILEQFDDLSKDERHRLKTFDWKDAFADVFKDGGFDAVIGNPPYVRQETLGRQFKEYAKSKFEVYSGIADLYTYFIEQSHRLLKSGGRFGMICSNKWIRADYGRPLRQFISSKTRLHEIVDFGELKVFQKAATFPAIILTESVATKKQKFVYAPVKQLDFLSLREEVESVGLKLDNKAISGHNWTLAGQGEVDIIEKMKGIGVPLGKYVNEQIFYGIKTGLNEAFVIDGDKRKELIKADKKSAKLIKPFVVGDDVRKYHIRSFDRYLIFTKHGTEIDEYPAIKAHLQKFKKQLMPRPEGIKTADWKGRKPGPYKWYEIQDNIAYWQEFEKPKILFPDIAKESRFTLDTTNCFPANTIYLIASDDTYLLGLLNSKLIFAYFKRHAAVLGDADKSGRLRFFRQDVVKIPIRTIDFKDKLDRALHNKMTKLVTRMLELESQRQASFWDVESLERQIKATDRQIDMLVYELYGLTEEEIACVERGEKKG